MKTSKSSPDSNTTQNIEDKPTEEGKGGEVAKPQSTEVPEPKPRKHKYKTMDVNGILDQSAGSALAKPKKKKKKNPNFSKSELVTSSDENEETKSASSEKPIKVSEAKRTSYKNIMSAYTNLIKITKHIINCPYKFKKDHLIADDLQLYADEFRLLCVYILKFIEALVATLYMT